MSNVILVHDFIIIIEQHIQWSLKRNKVCKLPRPIFFFPDSCVDLTDVMSVVDPLTKVEPGLKGTGDKAIPLQSVHIKARLLDLAAQVKMLRHFDEI